MVLLVGAELVAPVGERVAGRVAAARDAEEARRGGVQELHQEPLLVVHRDAARLEAEREAVGHPAEDRAVAHAAHVDRDVDGAVLADAGLIAVLGDRLGEVVKDDRLRGDGELIIAEGVEGRGPIGPHRDAARAERHVADRYAQLYARLAVGEVAAQRCLAAAPVGAAVGGGGELDPVVRVRHEEVAEEDHLLVRVADERPHGGAGRRWLGAATTGVHGGGQHECAEREQRHQRGAEPCAPAHAHLLPSPTAVVHPARSGACFGPLRAAMKSPNSSAERA